MRVRLDGVRRTTAPAAFALLLAAAAPVPTAAQESPAPERTHAEERDDASVPDDGVRTLRRLPQNWLRGLYGIYARESVVPFVAGGLASTAALPFDDDVRNAVARPGSAFGKTLETVGGAPSDVLVAGLFVAGRLVGDERFRAMSYDLAEAAVVNGLYTQLLKAAVRRERPDGSDDQSFPSGHASNAFVLATVVECHYGWQLGLPSYALAAAIGYSRIVRDKHYLSDVLAGATLGVIVGRAVVRLNGGAVQARDEPKARLMVAPVVTRDVRGLALSLAF